MRAMNTETTSRTGMTESRWAYLKALRPGFGHYLHVSRGFMPVKGKDGTVRVLPWPKGKTYNVGRNKAKRAERAKWAALRARLRGVR
jgi:hypothetical protein